VLLRRLRKRAHVGLVITMDAKSLFGKLAAKEKEFRKQEFLSPYTHRSTSARVRMDGLVYTFKISGFEGSGFGVFLPDSPTSAKFVREADFDVIRDYLDVLPKLSMVLCYQTPEGWVGYPHNLQAAKQKLGLVGIAPVLNVTDAQRFDTVIVRFDGVTFWFDEPEFAVDPEVGESLREVFTAELRQNQIDEVLRGIRGAGPEHRETFRIAFESWTKFRKQSTEEILQKFLDAGGGKLSEFVVRGGNIEVQWISDSGQEYSSVVKKDTFDVVQSGVCLSGRDRQYHMKDLALLMRQGESERHIVRTRRAGNARSDLSNYEEIYGDRSGEPPDDDDYDDYDDYEY